MVDKFGKGHIFRLLDFFMTISQCHSRLNCGNLFDENTTMCTISYTEPETGFHYSLVVTKDEASTIADANPCQSRRIVLLITGGTITFDGKGHVAICSPKSKNSFAFATEFVGAARTSLEDED